MICWWCHWGWPERIVNIRRQAEREIDALPDEQRGQSPFPVEYGPAHVVWADENFDDGCIISCIKDCDAPPPYLSDVSSAELAIVKKSLELLLQVPAEIRQPPPGYDGEHPEDYPPPAEWKVEKFRGWKW